MEKGHQDTTTNFVSKDSVSLEEKVEKWQENVEVHSKKMDKLMENKEEVESLLRVIRMRFCWPLVM